ncbi:MAG: hypothetical protein ACLPYB_07405 [Desulfobaccales bacterium]
MHGKLDGLLLILLGIYLLLLVYRVVPRQPKDPEKLELWHRKFGKMMKVLAPFLIGYGLLRLFGVL